jgi:hypothetical protein
MSGSAAIGAMATGTILAGLIITASQPESPAIREANWRYYMRNLKWDSEALQDQWSKPTKPKGHWQKNRLKPWAGRHGYESVNGWRGNSAKTILLDQIQQDAQK